jgi:hypothetical protein
VNLLEELEGSGWSIQQALLTTYPFDPQFFSGYVRPRLGRRNCDLPLVLMDATRYERNIASGTWREAPIGTDYLLEPVYSDGVFHPKVNLFASERSVYYTVSSANLGIEEYCKAAQIGYGAGFQKSWLTDDEYSVGEEYHIARDVLAFYEEVLETEEYVTGQEARDYIQQTATTLEWIDEVDADIDGERTTWLLSNLTAPILEQVVERTGDIETVQMYAPFYGTPSVLRQMADTLDADRLEFIVESESTAMEVESLPEALDVDFAVREMQHTSTRWVHAKFMTLEGEWGTACLYGSPNMTSTALLEPARRGNVEAGLLQVFPDDRERPLEGSLFQNASFPFELSEPVDDLSTLSLRSRSYEGWEGTAGRDGSDFRLRDAQLTKADSDDESELILRLGGITGEHTFLITSEVGTERRVTNELDEDGELSILLDAEAREEWVDAVVTVAVPAVDMESNARRVVQETQEYYREFRDMARSEGTQSSTTLLRSVLQNPDTAAAGVFNIAISELRNLSEQAGSDTPSPTADGKGAPQFPERSPTRLAGASSSTPSLPTLISKHLSYQRQRAIDLLSSDETSTPDSLERAVDHLDTFWETLELCLAMDCLGELDADSINDERLFKTCKEELGELLGELKSIIRHLNGVIARIRTDEEAKKNLPTEGSDSVADLPIWRDVFDSLFFHSGLLMELDQLAGREVTAPERRLANQLRAAMNAADPPIWKHLYDGTHIGPQAAIQVENLQVSHGEGSESLSVTGTGIRVLSLYLLVQDVAVDAAFLDKLRNLSHISDDTLSQLAEFAWGGEEAIVEYNLVGGVQRDIVLKEAFESVRELAASEELE